MNNFYKALSLVNFKSWHLAVYFSLFTAILWGACRPAASDFYVELLDTANINQSRRIADTIIPCEPDEIEQVLGTIVCEIIWINSQNRNLRVAYGLHDQIVAFKETINGITADSAAFYPNGQRMFRVPLNSEGQPSGLVQFYYPDGRLKESGRIILGVKNGVWRKFDEQGKLVRTEEFDKWGRKL